MKAELYEVSKAKPKPAKKRAVKAKKIKKLAKAAVRVSLPAKSVKA